jgi:PD-(D/E)XK nuclease superfamily
MDLLLRLIGKSLPLQRAKKLAMTYSYTQIAQYLRCPRSYRYRYLDGWKEKDSRATLLFGRCFEQALGAYFRREDSTAALFTEWAKHQEAQLEYSHGDSWERMFRQGVQLLERLAQDDRIEIDQPSGNLQVKLVRSLSNGNDFVAYIDAIGKLDGNRCLLEWKTTTSRYPEEPDGLLALDPQLVCYSWMSGISDVALVAFVRKRFSEIQYLKTTITDQQREEFGLMVGATASHIEAGEFLPHSGIRFSQNGCISCPQLGLCLGNQQLIESKLVRRPGASDLDWLDQLVD